MSTKIPNATNEFFFINWIFYTLVLITPLIVSLKVIPVPEKYLRYWFNRNVFDFFSYYKSILLIIFGLILFLILTGHDLKELKKRLSIQVPMTLS